MLKLGILHRLLAAQVQAGHAHEENITVSFTENNLDAFESRALLDKPDVAALDLELLGDTPLQTIAKLREHTGIDTVLVIYSFAKWSLIESLRKAGIRIVKAPISLRLLHSTLLDLVVKNIMSESQQKKQEENNPPPKRYTPMQLAQLQQIQSAIDCECPNHLADLVLALDAFEEYSRKCKNKNDKDAEMHTLLYRETAKARRIMEDALSKLCVHENIVLSKEGDEEWLVNSD